MLPLLFSIDFGELTVKDARCSLNPPDKKYKPQALSETGIMNAR